MRTGIVVLGSVFVDIKGYPLSQYIPAGRNVGRVVEVHGGVCRNVAEDIANVELRPTFLTTVDDSGTSTDVIEKLNRHQVNTRYIRRTPDGLGTWLAIFDNQGDVVASISKRPDLSVLGEVLEEQGDEIFAAADSVAVEFDMEPELLKKIIHLCDKYDKPLFAVISNMSIAMNRRDLFKYVTCLVCNKQEAELLFSQEFDDAVPEELAKTINWHRQQARIASMVVTLGEHGAVYASSDDGYGYIPPQRVDVIDTTGCGDAFFAGVAIGLTYGKKIKEACEIGTRLASSVIATKENVCPRFLPEEFDLVLPEDMRLER